ncbi:MAG: trehalose-phosphatase [Candidatus Omnitrophota bacterium]
MKHLFESWDKIKKDINGKYILLFLDYDGTLSPIVNTPDEAVIPRQIQSLLDRLSGDPRCKIAVISGRSLKDIKNKVGLKNIIYSGNHGMEIESPKIKFTSPVSPGYKTILEKIKEDLSARLSVIKGALVEDKGLGLSVHYRQVDKESVALLKTLFHEAVIIHLVRNRIRVESGKMVMEVRPPVKWDKGRVVMWLLARQRFSLKGGKIFPVYLGDDVTDEDAFRVLKNRGLTVLVGNPRPSHAQYYLKDTDEVAGFLKRVLAREGKIAACRN